MSKKLYIILGLVAVVLLVLIVLFVRGGEPQPGNTGEGPFGLFGGGSALPGSEDAPEQTGNNGDAGTSALRVETSTKLSLISEEPVAGPALVPKTQKVKYFKKATGHLFENAFKGQGESRISNVTIPGVLDAKWSPAKESVVLTYYSDGEYKRYYSRYGANSASGFLPKDIVEIVPASQEEKLIYTIPVPAEGEYAVVSALADNTNPATIFTTKVPDFMVSWPVKNTISLQTKGSAFAPGFLYTLNPTNGSLVKILDGVEGLSVLWSPSGKQFIYSKSSLEGKSLGLFLSTADTTLQKAVSLKTLPEKCFWSRRDENIVYCAAPSAIAPGLSLPDDWWQGRVSFNDSLWKINVITGERAQLLEPHQIDIIHLFASEDEKMLFFVNKKDDTLWSLEIE